MTTYSKEATYHMMKAGWYEGRQIDTTQMEELLRKESYSVFPSVVAFLQEFGGLTLRYPHGIAPPHQKICHFDIPEVIRSVYSFRVREDSENLETPLCLIGMMSDDDLRMTMDEAGSIYASYGGAIFLVGNSSQEALEHLYSGDTLCDALCATIG